MSARFAGVHFQRRVHLTRSAEVTGLTFQLEAEDLHALDYDALGIEV